MQMFIYTFLFTTSVTVVKLKKNKIKNTIIPYCFNLLLFHSLSLIQIKARVAVCKADC